MQDKTIDNALPALRKRIIREDGDGLDHVEALLTMRGVNMPDVSMTKPSDAGGRGIMRAIVLDLLPW